MRGTHQAADDDGRQWLLNFAAWAGGKKHRDQAESRNAGSDEHGAQAKNRTLYNCQFDIHAGAAQSRLGFMHQLLWRKPLRVPDWM